MDQFNRFLRFDDSRRFAVFQATAGILMSEIDPIEEFLANEEKQFDAMLKSLDELTIDDTVFDSLILELPDLPDILDIPELTRIKMEPKKSRIKWKRKTAAGITEKIPEFIQTLKKGE